MTLPLPPHFDPARSAELWVERAGELAAAANRWKAEHGVPPAASDEMKVAALAIDCQVSFCHPSGGLFVPGAVEDSARAVSWLYRNLPHITGLVLSLDTHEIYQIFHPAFWRDRGGLRPEPFTAITSEDIRTERWIPQHSPQAVLEYTEKLEQIGKYVLTIWPYHGLLGGISHALLPIFSEAMCFHAFCREAAPRLVAKGRLPLTEMYSVMAPEVTTLGGNRVGGFDDALYEHLMSFERIYVFGQASSHCVLATLEDLRARIEATDPSALSRIVILEDAMSPVPPPPLDPLPDELNFPLQARRRLDALVEAGMGRARTTDPISLDASSVHVARSAPR